MTDTTDIPIRGDSIDLDQFLKLAGIASSGGEAKYFIKEGMVTVNEEPEDRRRRKLTIGDLITIVDAGTFAVVAEDPA